MNVKAKLLGAAMGALGLCSLGTAALANSVTPPGERVGFDFASPLPEGLYFVDTGGVGNFRGSSVRDSGFDYNVPIIAWATPWTILGGRIQLIAAAPEAEINNAAGLHLRGMYNPFVAGQIAFNLGGGFSASLLSGAYIGVTGARLSAGGVTVPGEVNPFNQTTLHEQLALAYHNNGWNATANLMYGIAGKNQTTNMYNPGIANDYFNYDLALTKTLGKFELGIVGYGSMDTKSYVGYAKQSQFALGGLFGYNFGPVIVQVVAGTDIYERNYAAKETRLSLHLIIPLWNPEAPKTVVSKY